MPPFYHLGLLLSGSVALTYTNLQLFFCSGINECDSGRNLTDEDSFHLDVMPGEVYSYIDSLAVKSGHAFNPDEMKLVVNPIICYSGWFAKWLPSYILY